MNERTGRLSQGQGKLQTFDVGRFNEFPQFKVGCSRPSGADTDLEPIGAVEPLAHAGPDFVIPVPWGDHPIKLSGVIPEIQETRPYYDISIFQRIWAMNHNTASSCLFLLAIQLIAILVALSVSAYCSEIPSILAMISGVSFLYNSSACMFS